MNSSLLSKYRGELMGISILFIMTFHSLGGYNQNFLTISSHYFNIGVEFFLVLSGIGLFFSLHKPGGIQGFYERRFWRILPTYLIIAIPYYIYFGYKSGYSIFHILFNISTLNIILNDRTFWFISLILLCYIIAPFYYRWIYNRNNTILFGVPILMIPIEYLLAILIPNMEILWMRLPIFFLGMSLGLLVYKKEKVPVLCMSLILLLFLLPYSPEIKITRIIYFFVSVPILFIFCYLLELIHIKCLHSILRFLGSISLELYLVHEHISLIICRKFISHDSYAIIASFFLAVIIALILKQISSYVVGVVKAQNRHKK